MDTDEQCQFSPPPRERESSDTTGCKRIAHQATVVATFDQYRQQALSANQRRRKDYYSLPLRHRDLLPEFNDLLSDVDSKLEQNARFVQTLVDHNPFPVEDRDAALSARAPTESDHERVRSTLRQCARDWSETVKRTGISLCLSLANS